MESILWPEVGGRRVVLAVSGGIAAYKAAELCRLLVRSGAEVRVMMTASAQRFVSELTFAALSDHPVAVDLFDPGQEATIGHIGLADWAELLLLAPATANRLARMAGGLADDLLSTVTLAFDGPVLVAPAMNVKMWAHPATRDNVALLQSRGVRLVGPETGEMACGHVGAGRMAEPPEVLQAAGACLAPQDLAGRRVLVSAGPTHEPIDPVRFLGNRSSGKMGFALAAEAVARGAEVTLVSGPSALPTPWGCRRRSVTTAAEMAEAVWEGAAEQDVVVMAAAVADYRPRQAAESKLKKTEQGDRLELALERTEDVLAGLAVRAPEALRVGFAAETAELDRVAPQKLQRKECHLLVANDVRADDAGFETDTNRVVIYDREGGRQALPLASKRRVAAAIWQRVAGLLS